MCCEVRKCIYNEENWAKGFHFCVRKEIDLTATGKCMQMNEVDCDIRGGHNWAWTPEKGKKKCDRCGRVKIDIKEEVDYDGLD
jgi:hypothetical protein